MAPKTKHVPGLHRSDGGEWINTALILEALPPDWAVYEASERPEPWLASNANLHALRRLAIMADVASVRLLLKLTGQDFEKENQIIQAAEDNQAAAKACAAVQSARVYLTSV
jgi:hypothetical protein